MYTQLTVHIKNNRGGRWCNNDVGLYGDLISNTGQRYDGTVDDRTKIFLGDGMDQ